MRNLLFILVLTPFMFSFSCTNEDEKIIDDNTNTSQLSGNWKLTGKYNNGSTTNVATSCDLQYGKFNFSTNAVEYRGYQSTDCVQQTFTYDSFNIVNGQLKFVRDNTTYTYNIDKSADKLWLTKVSYQASGQNTVIIPTNEQVTNYYTK